MDELKLNEQELRVTAALYGKLPRVVSHVRDTGSLPETFSNGGLHIAMRLLIQERGTEITLTPDEQLIYDAIVRERRLPGGAVYLVRTDETGAED